MANINKYINYIADSRARRSLRHLFSGFLNDDDPTTFKAITFSDTTYPIIISGDYTTGITLSGDGTTGISVTSGFTGTTGISFAGTAADGLLISGACADGLHVSGKNTVSGIHISGDQAIAMLVDVDAALATGISFSVDTLMTMTTGLAMTGAGTITTGINLAPTAGTTGIVIGSGFTTGISVDSATDTSSAVTGSIHTDGGLGIAKALWVGTTITGAGLVTLSGNTGIDFTGTAITKGIDFANCTIAMTDSDNCPLSYGTVNEEVDLGIQASNFYAVQVHLHSTQSAAYTTKAMDLKVDTDGANTLNNIGVLALESNLSDNVASSGTLGCTTIIGAALSVVGEIVNAGFTIEGAYKPTPTGSNPITVLSARNLNTFAGESTWYVLDAQQNAAGNTVKSLIRANVVAGTATAGIEVVNTSGTLTTGINLSGAITTGITIAATSLTDAISITGTTPVDGIQISSACSATGVNVSGTCLVGVSIGASTTALAIGACTTGISFSGTVATGIDLSGGTLTTSIILDSDARIVNLVENFIMGLKNAAVDATFSWNDVTQTEAAAAFCKVYDDGAGTAYYNLADSASGAYSAAYQLFPDTELENDAAYFGRATPFGNMYIDISATPATYGADSLAWEYWDGDSWEALTIIWDKTDSTANDGLRSFQVDGDIFFSAPTDWAANEVDSQTAYWVRARVKLGFDITQIPLMNNVEHKITTIDTGTSIPYAGTLSRARFNFATPSTGTNDTQMVLYDSTSGACSSLSTLTKAKTDPVVADLGLTVAADDVVGFFVCVPDTGGTEYTDGVVEVQIART